MPNCFTLTPKGEDTPKNLARIDDDMCEHFGVKPHPNNYLNGWFDSIGLRLAMGDSLEEIKANYSSKIGERVEHDGFDIYKRLATIAAYLEERYTSDAFYQGW